MLLIRQSTIIREFPEKSTCLTSLQSSRRKPLVCRTSLQNSRRNPPIKVTATRGVTTLDPSRDVPMHKFDKSALSTDALYNFRTSLSVVVSFLETPKIDHDEKAALYLNAILKFYLIIALLVAEHILSSTVALTNYLQKRDIDLLEAVRA
jgi:hypothetical protein